MTRFLVLPLAAILGSLSGCSDPPPLPCDSVTCPLSQACDSSSGVCKTVSVCIGVSCPAGETCDGALGSQTAGTCITESCGSVKCNRSQICDAVSLTCLNPAVPTLGVQIDRVGRPLLNTLLTNPFDLYRPKGATSNDTGDQTKAAYNADVGPAPLWIFSWSPAIAQHLAYLDGLDGLCSSGNLATNQLGFGSALPGYGLLTYLLANDELLVDTSRTTCKGYLAVEQKALGTSTSDCGGRTLDYDVVDTTYTLLVNPVMPLTDGVAKTTMSALAFPYFQPPI